MIATARPARLLSRLLLLGAAGALLTGCETTGSTGPQAKAEPPMTHARAASECWMKSEKDATTMSLDRRADIVTKCIGDKMKAAQAGAPAGQQAAARPPESRR